MGQKNNVYLNDVGVLCAIASDKAALTEALINEHGHNMVWTDAYGTEAIPVGKCQQPLPEIPLKNASWQSRNNQIALAVYQQIQSQVEAAINEFGADRVGVIIGTSTSGIGDAEPAMKAYVESGSLPDGYHYNVQEMANTAEFIATVAGISGPVYGISTACSSGAKALASAKRLITAGICDVVIAGGVDSLCKLTLQGFSALEAVSNEACLPFSKNRRGINIGEAGALFIVSKKPIGVSLLGVGESSDAHHISAPHPEGNGAEQSMRLAIADAGLSELDIDYVNLHGTATELNDQMESMAIDRVFPNGVFCSSTKSITGHTLGAAGALEAVICWISVTEPNLMPKHIWDEVADPDLPVLKFVKSSKAESSVNYALSNSFAFGGNNMSLILARLT
ncbi:beta-ketoacyl-[acyl-carrier-protein] synthase family protein [Methylophaga sp. OBS3]|uniref:beta-ketoacyl-[acyl-carrier-protein] synthase family protein n=1 Tax=Methylophaga sp. OBS3 TaxID=2991934 RepID=UPI00225BD327|nr:beta-ketoacyl-[acyl-carrier-protein] synthase family protein [Methylophaga sp. OBS3]MCX4189075.1 beta-ketoacyl-[acyl-carrier-protein] synthase family protein [Methylophaga sp. OBS3]